MERGRGVGGEGLAYVIYTSGSTGQPKGVAVPHRAVVRLVRETNYVRLGPGDRTGQVANPAFDAATYEIWGALLTGAAVVVIPRDVVLDPRAFAETLRERRVTSMFLTSALFTRMAREVPDAFATMSELLVGGEAVDPAAARAVLAARPPRRLLNGYGPTESTTFAAWHLIRDVAPEAASIPIGLPLANTTLWVLDRWQRPVPPGVAGELLIGGDGLARGYLRRPELTAERFIPHPWPNPGRSGERLYRTGDLVRRRPDGPLELLGRLDHQVKIRGFRIEPGEIEAVLAAHPDVRECAVLARQDTPGDTRLVAYVALSPRSEIRDPGSDLRAWLQQRLPGFMIPSSWVLVDALPLTANGKLDRKALLALDEAPVPQDGFVAPRTPAEELLAGIFAEVLKVEAVGTEGHFFELGGHSLLATQVVSRVRQALGVELPLRALFEEPTVAALARLVERELRGEAPAVPPLPPVPRAGHPPLSFAQQRLWFIDQLEPDNTVYNVFDAVRLLGAARHDLLQASLEAVVRRHETLRTTFSQQDGGPVQVVHAWLPPDVATVDLMALPPATRDRELRRLAEAELRRPFNLAHGPLVRARFVALGPDDSAALLTLHHIVSDEWSMRVLAGELRDAYAALLRAAAPALPELPVQYADYAVWQRGWLCGDVLEAELAFWRRHLDGAPELLSLPTDRPRPALQSFRGAGAGQTLPAELARALRAASRSHSATLFMLYLTAFQILLARVTGESEIVVGTPVAGRNRLETEGLIGFFVNTLALRGSLAGRPSLGQLLARTREAVLAAYGHQELPFELLVEALNPQRALSHAPLFQVMMNLETGARRLELPELSQGALDDPRSWIAPFDLTLSVAGTGERARLDFEYATDLFDATTVERLLGSLRQILQALATAPETGLHEVELWSAAERHQVLAEWNDTAVEPVFGRGLHGLFEAAAREQPGAPAVLFDLDGESGAWTFAELSGRAGRLARRLREAGISAEQVVGVLAGGGPDLALGMLGALKAGAAFLPLDPRWPAARRATLLNDAGARVVLGGWNGGPVEGVPAGCAVLRLDADYDGPAVSARVGSPEQMAYVIYTSGSTGRPKGVAVGHGAAVHFAVEMAGRLGLGEGDRFLQFASPGFDVLIEEVFPVWARGGAVVFAPQEELLTPAGLERVIERHGVTGLELPTPYWNEWADDLDRRGEAPPPSLRLLLLGSEKPSVERLARWSRHGVPVIHVFGLTETAVTSTIHRWTGSEPPDRELPIGRPVGNTWLYVLDREGAPVPSGVVGQLFIGGLGVARGYLGRPELTAERFVPDPWGTPGARVYRTGDLARYRVDGTLDFLGRIDAQVKVRGFRIEPGEVAAVLEQHPAVSDAFVAVREERLIAWVVPAPGGSPDREALRSWLAARLPEPMVPSVIVELPALPRTINGKIDRAALPVPDREARAEGSEAPRTPVEELLAGIWGEILGRESVGRDEDFFALGGHSLLATRVVSRIRGVLGVDLPLRALFEAPTVAGLAQAVETSRDVAATTTPPPITPVPRDRLLPLSFAQHRLWLIDQLAPGSAVYNVPAAMRLSGAVEPALLERIFAEVVRRHEVLRTTFAAHGGDAVQIVAPPETPALPLIDLSRLPEAAREAAAHALAGAEAERPFDLQRGPLLRLLLIRLGAQDHLLLMTMHHVVSDGWSTDVLIREVGTLHAAFSRGEASPLPELPVQYADFAVWQREWLQGDVLETQLAVWRRRLAGAPQVLDLLTDRPRPPVQTFRGAERPVDLPADLAAAVREVSRREGATPFMTLLAAWAIVLGRHAGQDDLLIGAPVAGRNRQETEGLIGFFVNTLVLRADLSGTPTFSEALRRVRAAALEAFTHQDLPFERLVEEVVAQRNVARSPLIQVLFALQSGFEERLEIPELTLAAVEDEVRNARFELILNLEERPAGITGALEHNTDLFDGETIERLVLHFQTLLEAAVAAPETRIAELPLLAAAETRQLLEWGGAREHYAADETLATLFEARVRQAPEARAVTCEGQELTYAELDARANRLAHRLRSLGVGPEVRVGLCVERSIDLIVGLLGIVKAGGAYLPLDPSYPQERLAFLIEDSGARVVVTPQDFKDDKGVKDAGFDSGVTAQNTAYVIYTSGSTGRPKGVQVTHANAVRLFRATEPWFGFGPDDTWTLFHSAAFDFSVWEIWGALLYGGHLVIVPWDVARTPEAFHALLAQERVTVLNQTPTAFAALQSAGSGELDPLNGLRLVIFGGEALQPARLAPWIARHGDTHPRLVNMYGITETTVHVTYRPVSAVDTRSVIGRPIPDLAVRVLDPSGRLAPIGVPGELCVGGAGLSRGYLGRPDLTAERFVPDAFSGLGARLYRSGDLARVLPGGELEYLGRIDHQVKIRGFRIEPGEIEAALLAHPDVLEAVVLAREGRLLAFVVGGTSDFRAFLLGTLPEHQVPASYVLLETLPRTANGKVDRKALLELDDSPGPRDGFIAPRTPAEELLAGIFSEVLKAPEVGAEGHFFELGGHSLLATQVVSRVRQALGVELPLRALFEEPTVAALARRVERGLQGEAQAPPPLVPVPRAGHPPLSFAQQRLWFIDQLEPENTVYNLFDAVRLLGAARHDLLQASLETVVRRHETLRTTFAQQDGEPAQVVHAWLPPDVATIDLLALPPAARDRELRRLAEAELRRPFDLARGPLVCARFVALSPDDSAALLAMHHIVSDEWSMRVLVAELREAYAALLRAEAPALPELPVQYADYAVWQRGWLHGGVLEAELAFWRRHLAGAPELLALPTDRPRPAVQSFRGAGSGQTLPPELTGVLRTASRASSSTLFMLYLTAFQVLLARVTGESEIVVGTPVAGRHRLEVEGLIGFFVNTLALRGSLAGRPSLGQLLARTREAVLAAYGHQELPFELLVEALNPRRALSHGPLFQVMMNVEAGARRLDLPELSQGALDDPRSAIAPFDLTLSVSDTGERARLDFEYATDLFDAPTVERLQGFLRQVLQTLATAPDTGLHEVELWSAAERHQVLAEWNDTAKETSFGRGLHGLFEAAAREHPGAPAVFFEGGRWSYAELDGRAEGLARRLRALDVGAEQVVGVLAAGGPELALGMLGVLKSGGAFLPLDPRWPAARREALLEDARALALVDGWTVEPCASPRSREPIHPEQTAYVIYTSGSTGRPKGVAVGHGAAVHFAVEMAERFGLRPDDRFLQFASPGFDVVIEEVFPVWARGGAVVFAPQEELLTPAGLERVIERHGVTGLELPSPYWNEWADDLDRRGAAPPQSLRLLLLGSEKPAVARLARWSRHGIPTIHVFGLTETTVTSTIHPWTGNEPRDRELPIGRPVGNTRLYVLDRLFDQEIAPVPSGVVGELLIGGLGVARGYLGRPELTAERFVPDPFSAMPGARVYRTGDLARYRADGTLDFLGRIDAQVKVRGVRIEPGEVAAVLEQHPAVAEAFVAVRQDRLIAWVVPAPGGAAGREALRFHAAERLPEPMVPSEIVELPALPRTANGKIDRAALPAPEARSEESEAPRTPVEELLAGIWSEVLGRDAVGRDEDFFALGGHSLLATRVVSRIRGVLGIDLPLRALFEAPTVAGLARAVETSRDVAPPPPITPVPRDRPLPLSFAQHRLWLIDQLAPGSAVYNVPAAMRLSGMVEPALLERIFAEVVRRHEVLRTTFAVQDGDAVQIVAPPATPELPLIDLSRLPEAAREAAAHALAGAEAERPFDLESGPLLRLLLIRLGAQDHLLLMTMHHVVSDGWSTDVLIREVGTLHAAFSRGEASPLPELPVQYADFAVWQREWLQGEVLEAQLAVWRRRLAGAPQMLDLPIDRPRPPVQTFRGAERPVDLSAGLAAAVREVSRREGATPFMTLLAAWAAVLGRHAGQDDLLIGAPVAGRNRQETEELIGFFVNTLVLRADLSGSPSFAEALRRVRAAALEAFTHQDLPFERLVEEVVAQRDVARSPLIQVLFALQSGFEERLEIPELTLAAVEDEVRNARFELILNLEEGPAGIAGALEHNTDLFHGETIERLVLHFQTLLEAAVAAPETRIAELPLLAAAETRQLLEWGSAREHYAADETLATLFEARVRQAPEARAATCEGRELTYAELDARANRLAHRLRSLGVGPEVRVGLCVERSLELIVGMLGIVKAGGAYVPLDPSYPQERLAFLIEDAGAQVVVGTEGALAKLPQGGVAVCIDAEEKEPASPGPGEAGSGIPAQPQNSAYVIYTSGSTGRPKGVQVTHANAVRLFRATEPWFGFGPGDTWTLFHSAAFDFSVWEIWGALLYGGRLVVVPWTVSRTPEAFHDLLAAERVTVLNQTPSAFAELQRVDEDPARAGALADLRLVIFGGEALAPSRLAPWLDRHGDERPRLINMYGITETTVHVTYRPLTTADARSVIGRPIPDLAVHVHDRSGQLAPIGVPGELGVGGAGLALGYLGRPDLTAERFVPDPFSGEPGARLYRSGDLGRFLPSGELEYLGRIDHQVKIRGFRIEPGEIEAVLLTHPEVREAVVLARDGRLIAFVVGGTSDLRAFLLGTLPEHQIPVAFILLDALPLTANGKVDRKALLALDEVDRPSEDDGFAPPRTPAEELLAEIWRHVLGLDRVGTRDHFFALGGDSLLALQVVGRCGRAGLPVTPQLLFAYPVLTDLAAAATAAVGGAAPAAPPPIGRAPRSRPLPLSFAQERLWFIDRLEPNQAAYNVPLAIEVRGVLPVAACAVALGAVVRRHEALRTTFVELDGGPVQVIAPPASVPLPLVDLSALPAGRSEPESLVLASASVALPFDLARGPLLRAMVMRRRPAEHVLLLVLHHIVADGWSLAILMREIAEVLTDGAELPELAVQYADFAWAQRQQLGGDGLDRELGYWRWLLAGVPLRIELPADRPRLAAESSGTAGDQALALPPTLVGRVGEAARSLGVTPFMIYLAAYQVLLSRLTGLERLVIGIAVANRLQPEVEEIIGFFVNTLPLPSDLRGDPTVPDLLARVREATLGAFAHQQVPFERLVEELQPERSLEQTPVVQVMLVLQNATRPAFAVGGIDRIEVPGLSFEPLPLPSGAAKVDLILELVEGPQGLATSWEHRPRFAGPTVARWARGWAQLLAGLTGPEAFRVSELEMLSPAERHQLLLEWGDAVSDFPRDAAVHELFAARAAAYPEAVALIAPQETLTYGELAARAGRLAARLLSQGAVPDAPVAVCFERSPELIVALLAVLQAGGAYVPLDPAQPPERLAALLNELAPRLLLTSSRHTPLFAGFSGPLVLSDEEPEEPPAKTTAAPGGGESGGGRLAYVMFTSGSTGRPKGVSVTHRGVVRLVCETDYARFGPDEVWLQLAPASFDASTLEIWGALLHGGRLVLMPPGTPTLGELAAALARHQVTSLWLTAGLFHQMVEEDVRALAPVRQVLAGGEALSPPHVLRVARELPGTRLINGYGPTEGTTFSCCWPVRAAEIHGSVPIGRPIPDTGVLVLDAAGRPVPLGVAGELVISGHGLARGYAGRPDLTAERFRPHPLDSHPGERAYHTGDLVRFLPDGNLDFLGRSDRQVKIRGFRIEPAEVEAALAALPGVGEAAVVAHREAGGELRLLGFVTGQTLEPAAVRRALRGRLPEAFVPAAVWVVPALPLTANGKVDREALLRLGPLAPRGEGSSLAAGDPVAASRDPLAELVAGIWSTVLEVERVGLDDSFFDLGGHSLRATQVISRLRQASGVDLPLRLLFEAPTVAGLTARLRAALVSRSIGSIGEGGGDGTLEAWTAIPRRAPGFELPLSFAQERLWFLEQLTPGDTVYNIPGGLVLAGRLDVAALAAALSEVVRRHEGLRTVFRAREGRPLQVVLPAAPRLLPLIDLSALPASARAAAVARLQEDEALRPFDLNAGPLFRSALVRLETLERHLLLLAFHHIVFDGWSIGVLAGELAALYAAALERRPSPLPELPIQYGDFAVWQRSWLSGDNLERVVSYWRQRLTGVTPLRLPLDRPRPPLQTFSGDYAAMDLPPALAEAVRGLARRQAVTPFMVGLTAFVALLHRASGQSNFAVGTWVANRNRAELEGLIGFFVNNLALRLDLSGTPTFSRLLDQVREAALGAYAHQDLPFEKLIEDLKLPRDLSMPPVFQVVCVQQPSSGRMELPEVGLEPLSSNANPANVDLTLDLSDPAGGLYAATFVYNRDLFDRATILRFGHHFERLLTAALEAESTGSGEPAVDTLPLLSDAEAWQVAGEWSRGLPRPAGERIPGIDFVHQLVERHAALRPAAEAVVWPGDGAAPAVCLSYGELNARANRLARLLRRHGAGPEARVALWLPRSADLVVSALAVLKAGGCYVPLDATYSGERLAFMAADAKARVLVTSGEVGDLAPPPGATVLRLDDPDLAAALAAESSADLDPLEIGLDPTDLAYVIYTSGSTGRPKGTMIEHASLLTAYYAYEQAYRLGAVGTHLQMASFSFDVFTGDLVRALGSGARLVLCPREVLLDPARLHGLMTAERVEGAEFVPAVVRALVEHLERAGGSLDFMRLVVVSSDAWYAGEVEPLARLCGPRTRLIDSYGVTEATIDTTFLPLAAGDGTPCLPVAAAAAVVPIGRPLADNEAWVLGRELDLLPPRMPGELCIGGAGVARGYLDRPELTAEKFTPHPFSTVPGARLYRAGDLARWLPDGSVEFIGRVDSQIKVRGFRIEPGEIEAALGAHPQVRQAVVLALDAEPGRKHLVAYVVPQEGEVQSFEATEADVRAFLRQRLPDYMVPALFVPLAAMPLTPNGKVDRRALPAPDWSRSVERAAHQPPRTAAEEMLAAIWSDVLGVPAANISAFDDFFAIGGHSLLATQVVARLRAAVGVELPLRALFETPALAELAQVVEEQLILQMDDLEDLIEEEEVAGLS